MVLRLMQVFVPEVTDKNLDELLEGREVLGRWRDSDAGQIVLHLLVPAEETEPIMDRFEEHFSDARGFHVILFPVEAVLPRPNPEPDEDDIATSMAMESKKSERQRISREELYAEVSAGLGISRVYIGMTILSAVVAAVGFCGTM